MLTLHQIARAVGGKVSGNKVLAPGPGHSSRDRSLMIKLDPNAPDGFRVHSFAGDDWADCKDYVRNKVGLPPWSLTCKEYGQKKRSAAALVNSDHCVYTEQQRQKARRLWRYRATPKNSPVEKYLRDVRGYAAPIPATIGFLPPLRPEHHPAMIAAFSLTDEPEPGCLSIHDDQVCGVHLTLLKPDGSGKAIVEPNKIMVGPSNGWPIVLAPLNDLLGLIICEGIETGLSLHEATGCGVWAAGSASRMPALADKVPAYVDCITVAAEGDEAGRKGAIELADDWKHAGCIANCASSAMRRRWRHDNRCK